MAQWGSPCLQFTLAMVCRLQALLAGLKLNVWTQWPWTREAILCWYMMDVEGGKEEQVLPWCSIKGERIIKTESKKKKKIPQRNFCLETSSVTKSQLSREVKVRQGTLQPVKHSSVSKQEATSPLCLPQSQPPAGWCCYGSNKPPPAHSPHPGDTTPHNSQGPLKVV